MEAFAESCLWADAERVLRPETGPWHFVNVPMSADQVEPMRDCTKPQGCVLNAIVGQSAVLASDADPRLRAEALKFVAHFIGDTHQPLHISFAEDQGGNAIKGRYLGKDTNLHSVWDSGMIESLGIPWQQFADQLNRGITNREAAAWTSAPPLIWAQESLAATLGPQAHYRPETREFDYWGRYSADNLPTVHARLKMAGVRLAAWLEPILTKRRQTASVATSTSSNALPLAARSGVR